MKPSKIFLLVIGLIFSLTTFASEHTGHKHDAAVHAKLELNDGKKWSSDEPLRQAMNNIRSYVETALPVVHKGKFTPAQYVAFGKDVTAQIAFIVENCKLDPKADEQLHIVIGEIVSGIDLAKSKQNQRKRAQGVLRIADALNKYGEYFEHSGWQALQP